jgi:tripartite-type tricarboxylate transporter receptor subunit TctC
LHQVAAAVILPYRGGAPALTDLIGGQVQVMFVGPAVAIDHLKSGRLRALAVTSVTRWQGLPDVPTVGDVLPGYEVTAWLGVGAPKSTPAQIIDKLNRAINAGLADATLNARLAELGGTAMIGSPADVGKFISEETEKWGKVIRATNIKAE